jgi:hypothetical protein
MSVSTNAVQPVTIKTPDGAMAGTDSYAVDPYNGKDAVANGGRLAPGDPSRRAFAYFMMGSARYAPIHRLTNVAENSCYAFRECLPCGRRVTEDPCTCVRTDLSTRPWRVWQSSSSSTT